MYLGGKLNSLNFASHINDNEDVDSEVDVE